MSFDAPIIVFSHLRWNHVYQRPQHLLSRLAANRRVIFIEEPIHTEAPEPRWTTHSPAENVLVCQPHTNVAEYGYTDAQMPALKVLLGELLVREKLQDHVAWLYTPMALPLLESLRPRAVIYDCMDELSTFLHAPPKLLTLEEELLQTCDVVFTGGPSLYAAKKSRHANVHCFSSSVDAKHFARAKQGGEEAGDQAAMPRPRLGYFGVIDERIDLELLDLLAASHPEWQIVLVGPVAKIDPQTLPHRQNIHYFGQRSYEQLPSYLAGWDLCLMPFAINSATRFISPTKTLEYMAAERPIVSTPITDVLEPYGHIVYVGDTAEGFITECEQALAASQTERERRIADMRRVLAGTSWDSTAAQMESIIREIERTRTAATSSQAMRIDTIATAENAQPSRREEPQSKRASTDVDAVSSDVEPSVIVIGAGPTGLSAAYHLGPTAQLIEQNDRVGGWCRSIEENGFTFDYAGHIMFSNDPYVHELYEMLLGDNVHWQDREAWIYSKQVYTRYPFQGALYGLPPKVITECIMGAIEARFGTSAQSTGKPDTARSNGHSSNGHNVSGHASSALDRNGLSTATTARTNGHTNGHSTSLASAVGDTSNGSSSGQRLHVHNRLTVSVSAQQISANGQRICEGDVKDCCGDGVMESTAPLATPNAQSSQSQEPRNFEEFIYNVWGAGIAKHFAIPYNRKLWAVPLTEMETSWLGGRVPMPNLEEMIEGALQPVGKPMGPNARFGYPLQGGFQALMNGFLPFVKNKLRLNTRVVAVSPSSHTATLSDGTVLAYESLISTMPLPVLLRIIGDEAPQEIHDAAAGLRHVSVRCVNLGVGRENLTEKHWIYYPEHTVFHRIFVQGNASPHCNPPGGFGLTCEITYSEHKPLPCDGDELVALCIEHCREVGLIGTDDPILAANQVDMPYAYVVYDHGRSERVRQIRSWLEERDILLAGRYSEWEYYNSDHAFIAGRNAADQALERRTRRTGPSVADSDADAAVVPTT